jgi:hypothetical protein
MTSRSITAPLSNPFAKGVHHLLPACVLPLQGIGMEVVAYDIQKNPAVEAMGVKYVSIEDALPWADVVSVHVPLLKSTHHFINGDRCAACGWVGLRSCGCVVVWRTIVLLHKSTHHFINGDRCAACSWVVLRSCGCVVVWRSIVRCSSQHTTSSTATGALFVCTCVALRLQGCS